MLNKSKFKPLVSVIINSHNGAKYLNKSINSVLNQTYKNFEIIFYDNYSDDKTLSLIKKINNKKIKYFKSKKFLKLYHARDLAVKKAKGQFIAFLDVDDWWRKKKLEYQIKIFKNRDICMSYTNYFIYNKINKTKKIAHNFLPKGKITNYLLKKNYIGMCTLMIRKKNYFKLKKGFDHSYEIIGDYDLCLRLSEYGIVEAVDKCLSNYRWHNSNLSNTKRLLNFQELIYWTKKNKNFKKYSNFKYLKNFAYFQICLSYIFKKEGLHVFKYIKKMKIIDAVKIIMLLLFPIKLLEFLRNK